MVTGVFDPDKRGIKLGQPIATDRPCPRCDYNLRGLRVGGRCPECGATIMGGSRRRHASALTDASISYLKGLRWGCFLLVLGGLGYVILRVFGRMSGLGIASELVSLPAFCVWIWGCWIVTKPRQTPYPETPSPAREMRRTRLLARWGQLLWPASLGIYAAAVGVAIGAAATGGSAPSMPNGPAGTVAISLFTLSGALALVAFAGLVALGRWLARLAEWAGNDSLESRFRAFEWLSIIGGLGVVIPALLFAAFGKLWSIVAAIGVFSMGVGIIALLVAEICLLAGLLSLANMSRWAIKNANAAHESSVRVARTISERFEQPGGKDADGITQPKKWIPERGDLPVAKGGGVTEISQFGNKAGPAPNAMRRGQQVKAPVQRRDGGIE